MTSEEARVVEVGPRDGLQAEPVPWPTARKVELVERLLDAGLRRVEATSFVSPLAVPQLADAEELLQSLTRRQGVELSALVPNQRGLDRALGSSVDRIAVFAAASETFAQRNLRCSIDESFARFEPVVRRATAAGIATRGYISMAWFCPYEGRIDPLATLAVARRLDALGCDEIALADTVGQAGPEDVSELLGHVLREFPAGRIALHLHDTSGRAIENVEKGLEMGIRTFDAAIGGLGGCPFAPGSPGNLSTEQLVATLARLGLSTGIDPDALGVAASIARSPARSAA